MLQQLADMSATEGLAVTDYWLGLNDKQLKSLNTKWEYYGEMSDKVANATYANQLEEAESELDKQRNSLMDDILGSVQTGFADLQQEFAGIVDYAAEIGTTVNINGIQYQSFGDLVTAVSTELGAQVNRKRASYAV